MLWRYREAIGRPGESRLERLTALVGVGYFAVWIALGMAIFVVGAMLAAVEMQHATLARAVRSEEHTSELQSLMRISYAVFCLKKRSTKMLTRSSNILKY